MLACLATQGNVLKGLGYITGAVAALAEAEGICRELSKTMIKKYAKEGVAMNVLASRSPE